MTGEPYMILGPDSYKRLMRQIEIIVERQFRLNKIKEQDVCPVCKGELTYYDAEAYCHKCKQAR